MFQDENNFIGSYAGNSWQQLNKANLNDIIYVDYYQRPINQSWFLEINWPYIQVCNIPGAAEVRGHKFSEMLIGIF